MRIRSGCKVGWFDGQRDGWSDCETLSIHAGIAIGNGVHDEEILANSRIEYAYYHGLVGIDLWDEIRSTCCNDSRRGGGCDYPYIYSNYSVVPRNGNVRCASQVGSLVLALKATSLNFYYIYDSCNVQSSNCPLSHWNRR